MCTVCGCGEANAAHDHVHHADGRLDYGAGAAGVHVSGLAQERIIRIERDILSKNDALRPRQPARLRRARHVRAELRLEPRLGQDDAARSRPSRSSRAAAAIAVIEGDQQTSNDAERIRAAGAPAVQINTGKGCHLDAHMVGHALRDLLDPSRAPCCSSRMSAISSVPAAFDLGEAQTRRGAVGDRGRGQAAQISRHVCDRRSDAAQQGRPAASSRFRRRRMSGGSAAGQSAIADPDRLGAQRRRARRLHRLDRGGRGAAEAALGRWA